MVQSTTPETDKITASISFGLTLFPPTLIISFLLPQQELYLIGMDFDDIVGNYSKPNREKNYLADPIKLKKLQYALQIIEWLIPKVKIPIYLINTKPISDKFNYLTLEAFKERF